MKIISICLAAAAISGTLFAGCTKNTTSTSKTSGPSQTNITIGFVPPGLKSPFHTQAMKGAQTGAKALDYRLKVQAADKETDFNGQIGIVEQMVNSGVNGITISAINDKAIGTAIQKANDSKIPVIIYNSISPVGSGDVIEYIGYNQYEGGKKCGEYAAKLLNGKGKIAILQGIPGFHNTERTNGFKDAIKKFPGLVIVQEPVCDWLREKAANNAAQVLERFPDLALFFGVSDEMAIGGSLAAIEKGKKVFTVGIDGNQATLEEIEAGRVTATLGVYPDKMGETILYQMKKTLNGEKIPLYLETPGIMVDKQNISDYKAGKLWTNPIESHAEEVKKS